MKSYKEIIIDSGFFIALLNKNDQFHVPAKKVIQSISERKWITTWPILTEVTHMLVREQAFEAIQNMLDFCENGGVILFNIEISQLVRLKHFMQKYQYLPIDLADGSLILLAEELGHGDIVSTDQRDFNTYRWKNQKPFNNFFRI